MVNIRALLGLTAFFWTLPCLLWVLLGLTGPFLGLREPYLGLNQPSVGLTWPYWALLGLTGPYWALLDPTGPYFAYWATSGILRIWGVILGSFLGQKVYNGQKPLFLVKNPILWLKTIISVCI